MKDLNIKRNLTDDDRNKCLKLVSCGLSAAEIADIMGVSNSTVYYIRQAHTACLNKDFDTLNTLSKKCYPVVQWATQLTGVTFPDEEIPVTEEPIVPEESAAPTEPEEKPTAADILTREFMLATFDALSDIRNLLTEIRDILK